MMLEVPIRQDNCWGLEFVPSEESLDSASLQML